MICPIMSKQIRLNIKDNYGSTYEGVEFFKIECLKDECSLYVKRAFPDCYKEPGKCGLRGDK